jgi:hypothetical protein
MNPAQIRAVVDDWVSRFNQNDPAQNDPNIDKSHCFFEPQFSRCKALSHKPD